MVETQYSKSLFETIHFGTYFVNDQRPDPIRAYLNKTIASPSITETRAQELVALVKRKKLERDSSRVESPFFPGLLLKKTGTLQRIEKNARPWENIVDYLTRRYRIDQVPFKVLKAELDMTHITIQKNLRRLGIPRLKSWEYKDPNARATAASWEDSESRRRRSRSLKEVWRVNGDELVMILHSPEAEEIRRRKMVVFGRDNPDVAQRRTVRGRQVLAEAQEKEMERVRNENLDTVLKALLVDRAIGFKAASVELGGKLSPYKVSRLASRLGIKKPRRQGIYTSRLADAELFRKHTDLWEHLPERQKEALNWVLDENGGVRLCEEIGRKMGLTRAGVSILLTRAKANIELLRAGKPMLKTGWPQKKK